MNATVNRTVNAAFDEALARFKAAIAAEGFGVLYELDFAAIIAAKTGQPLPGRVTGLGVCDPKLARQALTAEPAMAALLPCAAYVAERGDRVEIGVLDPNAALSLAARPDLDAVGAAARERLERAVNNA